MQTIIIFDGDVFPKIYFTLFYCICVGICLHCTYVYHMYTVPSKDDRATEMNVIDAVSCHVDPENGTCVTLNG